MASKRGLRLLRFTQQAWAGTRVFAALGVLQARAPVVGGSCLPPVGFPLSSGHPVRWEAGRAVAGGCLPRREGGCAVAKRQLLGRERGLAVARRQLLGREGVAYPAERGAVQPQGASYSAGRGVLQSRAASYLAGRGSPTRPGGGSCSHAPPWRTPGRVRAQPAARGCRAAAAPTLGQMKCELEFCDHILLA